MKFLMSFVTVLLLGFSGFSCQSGAISHKSLSGETTKTNSVNSAELAYHLSHKDWCTNDEACKMIVLFLEGEDRYENFDKRLVALHMKGLVDYTWSIAPDEPVSKGTLAYMLCRALNIKGGLMMRLIPCRRYAYREALHHHLMIRGSQFEPLTGPEVVGIMGRAARMKESTYIILQQSD